MANRRIRTLLVVGMLAVLASAPFVARAAEESKLNVNTASVQELTSLRGIGEVTARAIVAHREQHGAFKSVDDLVSVKGVGPKTLSGIRERLTVGDGAAAPSKAKPAS